MECQEDQMLLSMQYAVDHRLFSHRTRTGGKDLDTLRDVKSEALPYHMFAHAGESGDRWSAKGYDGDLLKSRWLGVRPGMGEIGKRLNCQETKLNEIGGG